MNHETFHGIQSIIISINASALVIIGVVRLEKIISLFRFDCILLDMIVLRDILFLCFTLNAKYVLIQLDTDEDTTIREEPKLDRVTDDSA